MISIYNCKPRFQDLLRPVLKWLKNKKVSANQITLSSIFLSGLIGIAFWNADTHHYLFLTVPLGLLIRMGLNALDGMMAREYNQESKKGALLNEVGDLVSDVLIYFPLLKLEKESIFLIVAFICLSLINEFVGVMGKVLNNERRYDGPMGKSDRAFILSIYTIIRFLIDIQSTYIICGIITTLTLLIISTTIRFLKVLK